MSRDIVLSNGRTLESSGLKAKKSIQDVLQGKGFKAFEKVDKVILILLDSSGSMSGMVETVPKNTVAWKALQQELTPNLSGWNHGLISFGRSVGFLIPPTTDTSALVSCDKPHASGGTPMLRALTIAWDWIGAHANQARLVLLSDGCPTDASTESILSFAKDHASIPIDTVGIGSVDSYSYDEAFLKELSRITGGMFCRAHSIKMLATTIRELSPAQRPLLGAPNVKTEE